MAPPELHEFRPADPHSDDARPAHFNFDNSYARLPDRFYARVNPTRVSDPNLVKINTELAQQLGLDPESLATEEGVEVLAGNKIANGSAPIAMAYAGHQFGYFVPQLGDGRAILLGEVIGRDGNRYDVQLKGSGRTPFSRGGDGRAALGPVLREYIVSEAMHALGVPTTRTLAAVTAGDRVMRELPLPGAVLTRVASSHIRVGTFQYFAARRDLDATRLLADYTIGRHYPDAVQQPHPYRSFLDGVVARQARLIAQWMNLGFVHGVMNTDNTSIAGETIDYGPCAFLEEYHPGTVFSSIDANGRYAYGNQASAALWNLARLAEAILPLMVEESGGEDAAMTSAREALAAFEPKFLQARRTGFLHKIGLSAELPGDDPLCEELLARMAAQRADFTLTFRTLCGAAADPAHDAQVRSLFADPAAYDGWAAEWRGRLREDPRRPEERVAGMRRVNPAFIPRNHLVEEALTAATNRLDFQPFERLLDVVSCPYEDQPGRERYMQPARPDERVLQTFCGT
ncbi:YdiU family protein [Acidobacteria bacterium AB60]|nr:YdiU family protein [Acidobacteria bacterium AB60]